MERLYNGIIKENPTFVIMLGLCPTFAVTTSAVNAIGMGLSSTVVLMFSNLLISALRNAIPDRVRLPAEIVIVASLVTVVQLLMEGFAPASVNRALGIYIPLIVVNCIILGRAEAYALYNPPLVSFFDGLGMGLGFTAALFILGSIREILGAGSIFGFQFIPNSFHISIFVMAPGAFFVMAVLCALQNRFKMPSATNTDETKALTCNGDCLHCAGHNSIENHEALTGCIQHAVEVMQKAESMDQKKEEKR